MCYKLADRYASLGLLDTEICCLGLECEECDTMVLGSLIRGLSSLALLPGPIEAPSMTHYSVAHFTERLLALECAVYPSSRRYEDHEDCKFTRNLQAKVENRNATTKPSGMLESHRKHIEEQAKK